MNIDELEEKLKFKDKDELVDLILDIYCSINNLSHTEVRKCTEYTTNEFAVTQHEYELMYDSIIQAFSYCGTLIKNKLINP